MFKRNLLEQANTATLFRNPQSQAERLRIVHLALLELGVREQTGNNDGLRVKAYLSAVKLKEGAPWCAAFISFIFTEAGYLKPRSGWSPDLFPHSRLVRSALPGDVLGIYFKELGRIAHVGLVEKTDGHWCLSIEGNTNIAGSRDGEGVYRRRRPLKTIYRIANWIDPERSVP